MLFKMATSSGYLCLWFPNIPGQGTVFIEDQGPELLVELLPDDSTWCFFSLFHRLEIES